MATKKFNWRQHLGDVPSVDAVSNEHKSNHKESAPTTLKFFWQIIKKVWQDYCGNTSVHGAKYLTMSQFHWMERLWWILSMMLAVIGCILLSKEVYNKWQTSPVIVSFAEKYTRVSDIPFPAVTICPATKFRTSLLNFSDLYDRWLKNGLEQLENEEKQSIQLQRMTAVLQLCSDDVNLALNETSKYNLAETNIFNIMAEVAPTFDETMVQCKFQNHEKSCHDYFQEVVTDEGMCYTFNSRKLSEIYRDNVHIDYIDKFTSVIQPSSHWTLDNGYSHGYSSVNNSSYPRRVFGSGNRDGLSVILSLNKEDFDEKCDGQIEGFKVQLHMPGVIPLLAKHYFYMPMQRDLLVSVNPQIIRTDDDLKLYAPNIRQCFFSDEKRLTFFKDYTKSNCDLECLTNFTLQKCRCVRFSMPRNDITPICGVHNIDCCIVAEDEFLRQDDTLLGNNELDDCNCLPSCTSYVYTYAVTQNSIKTKSQFSANREFASMKIFFSEKQFMSSKRSRLFGHIEVLANFGGLLGLCMGVSLLSFVEIIYYFTLRIFLLIRSKIVCGSTKVDDKIIYFIKPRTLFANNLKEMENPSFILARSKLDHSDANS